MMTTFLNVANNAESTLSDSITSDATQLTVATGEGARFPSGNFHITIKDEILKCTSRDGDAFTVQRAQEGTTAAAHSAGVKVQLRWTAGYVEQIQSAISALEAVHQGPLFKVTQTIQQSVPNVWTKVQFDTVVFDTHNGWNSQNYRWVCPVAGYYMVFGIMGLVSLPDGKRIAVSPYVNGNELARVFDSIVGATSNVAGGGGALTYLNEGDYVELFIYHNNSTNLNTIATAFTCQLALVRIA